MSRRKAREDIPRRGLPGRRRGFLATASCSALASEEAFKNAIYEASLKAGVTLKQVSATGPSPDHPETIGIPETKYLKFFIFQII